MAELTPVRKALNRGVGAVLLVAAAWVLWIVISRPLALWSFCGDLAPGTAERVIRQGAADRGFRVSAGAGGIAHVYDFQSFGKFSCELHLQGGVLRRASFAML